MCFDLFFFRRESEAKTSKKPGHHGRETDESYLFSKLIKLIESFSASRSLWLILNWLGWSRGWRITLCCIEKFRPEEKKQRLA